MASQVERNGSNAPKRISAKETIIQALDSIENENEQIKQFNNKMQIQVKELERENERLRNELNQMKSECDGLRVRFDKVESLNSELYREIQLQTSDVSEKSRQIEDMNTKMKHERVACNKQLDEMRNYITQKEEAAKRTEREVEALRNRLENAARKNYNDRDIELLHEVEMLKEEKNDLSIDKEHLEKLNKKLRNEMSNFENLMDNREAELKNESRRHSLLTKEFNSLLDENNRLKLQIRRRPNQGQPRFTSPSSDNMAFEETISELPSGPQQSSRGSKQSMKREPSLIINNEVFQPTKDYPFPSSSSNKDKYPSSSRMPNMNSREPSLVKRGSSFSVRDGRKGGRPSAARQDDRTTPESLPNLDSANVRSK